MIDLFHRVAAIIAAATFLMFGGASGTQAAENLRFGGQVVDQRGQPIAKARITASYQPRGGGTAYIDDLSTDAAGRFTINRETALSGDAMNTIAEFPISMNVIHPDFLPERLDNLEQSPKARRESLRIVLHDGKTLTGNVTDAAGNPLAKATVFAVFDRPAMRKAAVTADDGTFKLRGLPASKGELIVRRMTPLPILCARSRIDLQGELKPVSITAKALELPPGTVIHELFGMKLIDLNADLRKQLGLHSSGRVMILDTGEKSKRLGIGNLEACDAFWLVGEATVNNFSEFAAKLLAEHEQQQKQQKPVGGVRVVYNFERADGDDGSNTQYMKLTSDDVVELKKLTEK